MASKIIQSYLLNSYDYSDSDKIIYFLTSDNKIQTGLVKGIKKITSKNSRYLTSTKELEIEYFPSKENRLSRIKKIYSSDEINNISENNYALVILQKLILALNVQEFSFEYYTKLLNYIYQYPQDTLLLSTYFLLKFHHYFGLILDPSFCGYCYQQNLIIGCNKKMNFFVCNKCWNPSTTFRLSNNFFELWKSLINDDLNISSKYKPMLQFLQEFLIIIYNNYFGIFVESKSWIHA